MSVMNGMKQTAVLYAVQGTTYEGHTVWQKSSPHQIDFTDKGRPISSDDPAANRYFLVAKIPPDSVAAIIAGLMTQPPDNPQASRSQDKE
jgi:hypothetical protein